MAWREEQQQAVAWRGKTNNSVGCCFCTYDLCNPNRRRMCTWRVFALIWSPVPQQLPSFLGPKTGRGYSAVVLDRSQAPPISPSLFYAGMLGGACERSYSSLVRLPQQLHEQYALLSLLSWAYSACVRFALLFQQRGALSRSILRFSFRLLRCLRCPSLVTSRTRLCHIDDPRSFTSRTSISTTP